MENIIRLFRAVPVKTKQKGKVNKTILRETIKNGFIFAPEIFSNFSEMELLTLVVRVKDEIGLSSREMNNAFHKSWKKVATVTDEQLFIEQIVHYFTTYGFEQLGIYDKDSVYVPDEVLKLPKENPNKIKLVVIKGYTKEEIKEKIIALLQTGIALKEDTKKDVLDVALWVELNEKEIREVKNKEVKAALYDYLNLVPENAVEFLRFLVYKATDSTLLIKNKKTIEMIKQKEGLSITGYLARYKQSYGLEKLAEIFYRFKPLWLAFRTNSQSKKIINKIRKLAITNHKPIAEDYLNTITSKLKNKKEIDLNKLDKELSMRNIFRKIRLAHALNFRTKNVESIVYKVRNGKGYATSFSFDKSSRMATQSALNDVLQSIVRDIKPQVEGKHIYIPENVKYALPATEKQFTGNLPSGSYISIPKDMIIGIHWEDIKDYRVDLDFSMISLDGKYGWDRYYRNEGRSILFSGDLTSASKPNGASELFYIGRQDKNTFLVSVNYYNYDEQIPVPFKIFVAKEQVKDMRKNYVVNPNNILLTTESKMDKKQKTLGILTTNPNECRFYFSEVNIGNAITSSDSEVSEHSRKYLVSYLENAISLNDILVRAGATVYNDKEKALKGIDIDLSPELLEKDTIIKLLTKSLK
jgi:hypothetical protein